MGEVKIKDNLFGDMLFGMVEDVIEIGKKSEVFLVVFLLNEVDVIDVVIVIFVVEVIFEIVVVVWDKVI